MSPRFVIAVLALFALPAFAQSPDEPGQAPPLPDPLRLVDALRLSRDDHPAVQSRVADRIRARSGIERAHSRRDWQAWLDLDARATSKARLPGHAFKDDSRASVYVTRLLADFGEGAAAVDAAIARLAGAEQAVDYARALHRVDIMERFLEVRLADLRYFVDDEDMTLAFLRFDRVRDRREQFEEFAEIDELELEAEFRRRLVTRARSAHRQRAARNALSLAMGRPGELADNVVAPVLDAYDRPVPDYDEMLESVVSAHPLLAALSHRVEAAEMTLTRHEVSSRPEIFARFEATEWSQETGNRDQYVAGLQLLMPLGGDPARSANIAEAMAEKHRLVAEHRALEFEIRHQVLMLVQRLQELELAAEAAGVEERFRDLYLDRSRTLYQLEVRTDLGDSQARQAEAVWRSAQVSFERALAWARLDAMRGLPLALSQSEDQQ